MAKKKKKKKNKNKAIDTHPNSRGIFFKNYDIYGPTEGDATSPGTGLYGQDFYKYKSVKDFIEKARKRPSHMYNTAAERIAILKKFI